MVERFRVPNTHSAFKINKLSVEEDDLAKLAYNFIKEGEAYEGEVGDFILDWLKPSDFIEVTTSGSTGKPKKIKVRKEHMINSARATGKFFDLPAGSTALMCMPAKYIAGKMMLVRAMVLGWQIDLVPPSSNPLDNLYKTYDFCAMTPFQLDNSLSRLHLIKNLIVGGGAVSTNLQEMVQGLNTKVYETFGMTETVSHIAAKRLNGKKKKASAFKLMPNVHISVDSRNCLVIKAPSISDEILITNDVVEIDTYKKFFWKGRFDNVVNSGGIKLFPEDIERRLSEVISGRFFLIGMPDNALGEKLVLFVEADFSEDLLTELHAKIQTVEGLHKYEIPKKIYLIQKFEETPNGKIHRKNTLRSKLQ